MRASMIAFLAIYLVTTPVAAQNVQSFKSGQQEIIVDYDRNNVTLPDGRNIRIDVAPGPSAIFQNSFRGFLMFVLGGIIGVFGGKSIMFVRKRLTTR